VLRRLEPRTIPTSSAHIAANGTEHDCKILDVSERGARLSLSGALDADSFELIASTTGPARSARVRWRLGNEIGVQFESRQVGEVIPDIHLAAADPPHSQVSLKQLIAPGRSVLVGVVGAFAPERLQIHFSEVHSKAADLHRVGFDRLVCVVPNDPWTVRGWAGIVDPERRLTFLSDGHLELGRWLGATFTSPKRRHLGPRPRSYLALVRSGVIERLTFDGVAASLMFNEAREEHARLEAARPLRSRP
jgi:peroxiredoxin